MRVTTNIDHATPDGHPAAPQRGRFMRVTTNIDHAAAARPPTAAAPAQTGRTMNVTSRDGSARSGAGSSSATNPSRR
jgi:hypothetical protein